MPRDCKGTANRAWAILAPLTWNTMRVIWVDDWWDIQNTTQAKLQCTRVRCFAATAWLQRSLVKNKALTSENMAIVAIKGSLYQPLPCSILFAPDAPAEPLVECISSPFAKKPPTLLRAGLPWTIRYSRCPCLICVYIYNAVTRSDQEIARPGERGCCQLQKPLRSCQTRSGALPDLDLESHLRSLEPP